MAWTYDTSQLSASDLYKARLLVGDTNTNDQQFQDEEISFMLTERGSTYGAAASLCRALAARFAREADTSNNELRTSYSQRSASYLRMAVDYEKQAEEPDDPGGVSVLVAGLPAGFTIPGLSIPPQ